MKTAVIFGAGDTGRRIYAECSNEMNSALSILILICICQRNVDWNISQTEWYWVVFFWCMIISLIILEAPEKRSMNFCPCMRIIGGCRLGTGLVC